MTSGTEHASESPTCVALDGSVCREPFAEDGRGIFNGPTSNAADLASQASCEQQLHFVAFGVGERMAAGAASSRAAEIFVPTQITTCRASAFQKIKLHRIDAIKKVFL